MSISQATDQPLVSVAMLTFNCERFVGKSIESIIYQDYQNLEIIISDNASEDRTQEICRQYQAKDPRIHFTTNETNMGARFNAVKGLGLATRGKYFMWASDHDLWHPSFVSKCVSILENDPAIVLAYPQTMRIDAGDQPISLCPNQIDTRNLSPAEGFRRIIRELQGGDMYFGLMRNADIQDLDIATLPIWGGDQSALAALALRGSIAFIPEVLFYWRVIRDENMDYRRKTVPLNQDPVTGPALAQLSLSQLWRTLGEGCLKIIDRSSLSAQAKAELQTDTKRCFMGRYGVNWEEELPAHNPKPQLERAITSDSPLVSVIVTTCNHPDMLMRALQSVLSQTCKDYEIIVVNDGGLAVNNIVGWLNQQGNITYVRHDRRRGPDAARHTGLKLSRGKYLAYLNDDESLDPDHLETLVAREEVRNKQAI